MIILSSNNSRLEKPECGLLNYHIHFLASTTDMKDTKYALGTAKNAIIGKPMLLNINALTFFNYQGFREDVKDYGIVGYVGLPTVARLYGYYKILDKPIPAIQRVLLAIEQLHNGTKAEIVTSPEKWISDNFSTRMISSNEIKEFSKTVNIIRNGKSTKRDRGPN